MSVCQAGASFWQWPHQGAKNLMKTCGDGVILLVACARRRRARRFLSRSSASCDCRGVGVEPSVCLSRARRRSRAVAPARAFLSLVFSAQLSGVSSSELTVASVRRSDVVRILVNAELGRDRMSVLKNPGLSQRLKDTSKQAVDDLTLVLRANFAEALYRDAGASRADILEAVAIIEDVRRARRRVLGKHHPDTGKTLTDLDRAQMTLEDVA